METGQSVLEKLAASSSTSGRTHLVPSYLLFAGFRALLRGGLGGVMGEGLGEWIP